MDPKLFTAFSPETRASLKDAYVEYCYERFGVPDFSTHQFSNREAYLEAFRSSHRPQWSGRPIPQHEFDLYYRGRCSVDEASRLTALLVRMARANAIEGWGVRYHLQREAYDQLYPLGVRPTPRALATMQEVYHDALLREAVGLFGIEFDLHLPGKGLQEVFKSSSYLPSHVSEPLTLITEIIGAVAFLDMLRKVDECITDDVDIAGVMKELIGEVIIDEIGHITALLIACNQVQLDLVRWATPLVGGLIRQFYHRDNRLDARQSKLDVDRFSLDLFPVELLARAFVPLDYLPAPLRKSVVVQNPYSTYAHPGSVMQHEDVNVNSLDERKMHALP